MYDNLSLFSRKKFHSGNDSKYREQTCNIYKSILYMQYERHKLHYQVKMFGWYQLYCGEINYSISRSTNNKNWTFYKNFRTVAGSISPRKIGYCPKSGLFLFGNQSRFQVLFAFRKLTGIASTSIGGTILNRYAHSYLLKINKRYSDNNIHLRSRTQ